MSNPEMAGSSEVEGQPSLAEIEPGVLERLGKKLNPKRLAMILAALGATMGQAERTEAAPFDLGEIRIQTIDSQVVIKNVLGIEDEKKLQDKLSFMDALQTAENPLLDEFKSLPSDRAIIELLLEKIGEMLDKYRLDPSIETVLKQQVTESVLVFIKDATGTAPAALLQEEGGVTTTDESEVSGFLDKEDVKIGEVRQAVIANRGKQSEVSYKSLLDYVKVARETGKQDEDNYRALMREAAELGVIGAGTLEMPREDDEIKP